MNWQPATKRARVLDGIFVLLIKAPTVVRSIIKKQLWSVVSSMFPQSKTGSAVARLCASYRDTDTCSCLGIFQKVPNCRKILNLNHCYAQFVPTCTCGDKQQSLAVEHVFIMIVKGCQCYTCIFYNIITNRGELRPCQMWPTRKYVVSNNTIFFFHYITCERVVLHFVKDLPCASRQFDSHLRILLHNFRIIRNDVTLRC